MKENNANHHDNYNKNKKDWKNVRNLGFVSFFTDVSSEMIFGILPIFIIDELGAGKAALGLIEGIGESAGYSSRTVSGALSDKFGKRKPFVIFGYSLSAISKPVFAVSSAWFHAAGVRVADRIGKGIRTSPRDALLSDSVSTNSLGKAFGLHRTMDQAGAVLGPLLAFGLLFFFDIRDIFWFSLIPASVSVIILVFYVKEKRVNADKDNSRIFYNFKQVLSGKFLVFLGIVTVFSIGAFNFSFILVESADLGVEIAYVPLIYVVINLAHTAIGVPAGMFSDRIGAEWVLVIGFALFLATSVIGFFGPQHIALAVSMAVLFGLYRGVTVTSERTVVSRYVQSRFRATAFGIYYLFMGVSFLVANSVFGLLSQQVGTSAAFGYSITTAAIGMCLLVGFLALSYKK